MLELLANVLKSINVSNMGFFHLICAHVVMERSSFSERRLYIDSIGGAGMSELCLWWQHIRHRLFALLIVVAVLTILIVLIYGVSRFGWGWTGFAGGMSQVTVKGVNEDTVYLASKTLWDWLQLLGVLGIPVMVGVGAAWFSYRQNLSASRIAEDQQREDALQTYIDKISELLLNEQLGGLGQTSRFTSGHEEAQHIVRARTLAILPRLDGKRKRSVLLFLYEARILNLFDWSSADLTEAVLHDTTFSGANLSGAKLSGADLTCSDLSEANLRKADLSGANLVATNLQRADLSGANLTATRLNGSNLSEANLSDTDLSNANLSKTIRWGTKSRV
jgi:uncharacterized protein YjbI with pentapeptide repeats